MKEVKVELELTLNTDLSKVDIIIKLMDHLNLHINDIKVKEVFFIDIKE